MYSVVMLAAMTAAPEAPEFCGLFSKCRQNQYCGQQSCGYGCYRGCGYGCGYGKRCGYGGCGYGGGRCCFLGGCGLFGRCRRQVEYPNYGSCEYGQYSGGAYPADYSAPGFSDNTLPIPQTSQLPADQGQILVKLPANAKLFANDHLTTDTGSSRVLTTPVIGAGQDHHYTLKIEYTVDGESRVASKQVVVRGGMVSNVDFASIDSDKTTSAVSLNLPENSKLFIDGKEAISKGGRQNFNTAELAQGRKLSWNVRVESEINGTTVVETRDVTFKAGEPVSLDFSAKAAGTTVVSK